MSELATTMKNTQYSGAISCWKPNWQINYLNCADSFCQLWTIALLCVRSRPPKRSRCTWWKNHPVFVSVLMLAFISKNRCVCAASQSCGCTLLYSSHEYPPLVFMFTTDATVWTPLNRHILKILCCYSHVCIQLHLSALYQFVSIIVALCTFFIDRHGKNGCSGNFKSITKVFLSQLFSQVNYYWTSVCNKRWQN